MDVRSDLADALARLDAGLMLAMPLSRAMPSIGRAVHELRLRDRSGHYRVIYALIRRGAVHVLHAFKKTTQTTHQRHIRSRAKAPEGDHAMNKKTSADRLAKLLGIPKSRGLEAVLKAQLIAAVLREIDRRGLTHAELAAHSGLSRSAVTGILSGSLQKVTIDRVLRLVEAAGLEADIRVRRAA
jgi:phage-related protein/predicted XRE-type DNA-binding protein